MSLLCFTSDKGRGYMHCRVYHVAGMVGKGGGA